MSIRILDVIDDEGFRLVPPCADPGFDHRSCDYWEDADRGSRAARLSWLAGGDASGAAGRQGHGGADPARGRATGNPFADDAPDEAFNPFAPATRSPAPNPFAPTGHELLDNPFAPRPARRAELPPDAPPKLRLLARGLAVFGSYAKVLLADEEPAAYAQFGPLSAYPRAMRTRELYPSLPGSPLPAVITCIATTAGARRRGLARALVEAVCDDLAGRGFAAVEAYPEVGAREDATSAAQPGFWAGLGFVVAAQDERFPVMRRELA